MLIDHTDIAVRMKRLNMFSSRRSTALTSLTASAAFSPNALYVISVFIQKLSDSITVVCRMGYPPLIQVLNEYCRIHSLDPPKKLLGLFRAVRQAFHNNLRYKR